MPLDMISGFFGAGADNTAYQIPRSLRFNAGDSPYLSFTPGASNRDAWTLWFPLKRAGLGITATLLSADSTSDDRIYFNSSDQLCIDIAGTTRLVSTEVFRDPAAWGMLRIVYDAANGTAANRLRVFKDAREITAWGTDTRSGISTGTAKIGHTVVHNLGRRLNGTTNFFDGYLADAAFKASADVAWAGQTDATTGQFVPTAPAGALWWLNFSDNSGTTSTTLGKDNSGNSNNWTPNNFSVTAGVGNDSLTDTPTNNFCVLNRLNSAIPGDGNLAHVSTTNNTGSIGTMPILPGEQKYFEFSVTAIGASHEVHIGVNIESPQLAGGTARGGSPTSYSVANDGTYSNGSASYQGSGTTYTVNDVIGIAVDRSANQLVAYKNGVSLRTITGLPATGLLFPWVGTGGGTTSTGGYFNFGQRTLGMTAPAGHTTPCTANLATPSNVKPGTQMSAIKYAGVAGTTQAVTGLGFQPDLVWIKRQTAVAQHVLTDSVRGAGKSLYSSQTTAETTNDSLGYLSSFDSDGFTLNNGSGAIGERVKENGAAFIAWAFKKGVTPGFDIVSGTSTGTSGTLTCAHTLGVAPAFILARARPTTDAFYIWHQSVSSLTGYLLLNSTAALATAANIWGTTGHTSSNLLFGQGTFFSASSQTFVAYAFAEVTGFSRFRSYTGNGSADGPFVHCGFRPRFILIKESSAAGNNWFIFDTVRDTYNAVLDYLQPNTTIAEAALTGGIDVLSNGFKLRTTSTSINTTGSTYIFAAFAESAFKYSNAR